MTDFRPSWTQACCTDCWYDHNPGREPSTLIPEAREVEVCCYCGIFTENGVYIRVDPATVKYPVREKD